VTAGNAGRRDGAWVVQPGEGLCNPGLVALAHFNGEAQIFSILFQPAAAQGINIFNAWGTTSICAGVWPMSSPSAATANGGSASTATVRALK